MELPSSSQHDDDLAGELLYIEDNPVNAILMEHWAHQFPNLRLRLAPDATRGLMMCDEQAPDVLLLDMCLPDMHGFAVIRRLREDQRTASLPVVVLSASNEPDEVSAAMQLGASLYWRKPVDFKQIHRDLSRLLDSVAR